MANSDQINKEIEKWVLAKTKTLQTTLNEGIKDDTPVRTGTAQAGWQETKFATKIGDTAEIRNEVPYIGWLEFGTDRMQPFGMVRRNLQKVSDK